MFDIDNLRASTDIVLIASTVGLFLPYLIALINQPTWKPATRGFVTQVIYGVTGVFIAYWAGDLSEIDDIMSAVVPIFLVSMTKYSFLDKPSNLAPRLEYSSSKRDFNLYPEDQLLKAPGTAITTVEPLTGEVSVGTVSANEDGGTKSETVGTYTKN